MKLRSLWAVGALGATIALAGVGHASNLLVNGSFETGDFTGWTLGDPTDVFTFVATSALPDPNPIGPEDGAYFAALGTINNDNQLIQSFGDSFGQSYVVSFWLGSDGFTPNNFSANVGAAGIAEMFNVPQGPNTLYQFAFIGSGADTLVFTARNDPGYFALDNVTVTAGTLGGVPEPASWALMIGGFGLTGAALRRRRGAVAA